MRFVIILLILCSLSTSIHSEHALTFAEFEAREQLMQYQINIDELFNQLRYAEGPLREKVLEEIQEMLQLINQQVAYMLELDQKHHGK